tara:strand:+ start:10550 stop:11002 length:453 start_codon:yes stop_codon:yes gene_type:complete
LNTIQDILTSAHSVLVYIVLIVLILAFLNAVSGWLSKREKFEMSKDLRISLFAIILSHIQLLLGLIVYFISSNGLNAITSIGVGNLNSAARLLALENPTTNIIAIVLITIGWSKHNRKETAEAKFKMISLYYGLGLLLILRRLPWSQWFG